MRGMSPAYWAGTDEAEHTRRSQASGILSAGCRSESGIRRSQLPGAAVPTFCSSPAKSCRQSAESDGRTRQCELRPQPEAAEVAAPGATLITGPRQVENASPKWTER